MNEIEETIEVRNSMARCFNEAVTTYGPAVAISAACSFAASALHQAEHMMAEPNARHIVLGRWTTHFHAMLEHLNNECDLATGLQNTPPEGQA